MSTFQAHRGAPVETAIRLVLIWLSTPTTAGPHGNVVEEPAEDGNVEFRCKGSYSL